MLQPRATVAAMLFLALLAVSFAGCNVAAQDDRPHVAFVTNGISEFWIIAEAGALAAAEEFDVRLEIRMPPSDGRIANQKRMLEELITLDVDGIAVSPIDPINQSAILDSVAEHCFLVTHDSDAPDVDRVAYVGVSNYEAGRMCGALVKKALPEGGEVMIFIGSLDQDNSKLRRQGVIDELLDRSVDPSRYDPPEGILEGDKYTILDTRVDNFDFSVAKAYAEDALVSHPEVDCMVGLFGYIPPFLMNAVKSAERVGEVKVVGFDEDDETLQGIIDGTCDGTIVQNPYMYGYESVRILAGLSRGDQSVLPEGGIADFPAREITRETVEEFWAEKRKNLGEEE